MAVDPITSLHRLTRSPVQTRILVIRDDAEMLLLMDRALGDSYECEFASSIARRPHEKLGTGAFQLAICRLDAAGSGGVPANNWVSMAFRGSFL